jgi:hypothetical protein
MTAPARISQADIDRAVKAAGKAPHARVVLDLAASRIEIILGEPANDQPPRGFNAEDA